MSLIIQTDFAAALVDPAIPVPQGLTAWTGPRNQRRFQVYRDNVSAGLTAALASRFPVTEKIVGAAFFAAMAQEFIRRHPPRSPLLLAYGDTLADFAADFEATRAIAYLPDVIRLEAARGKAYHAADAAALTSETLAEEPPERLAELVLAPHPSLSILRSAFPIVTIWAMNADEIELAPIYDWTGEDALVVRPQMIVEVRRLPPGGAAFLMSLAAGEPLGAAVGAALADAPDFDLSTNLAGMLQSGVFTGIDNTKGPDHA